MISYREQAGDLANKVNMALEKRAELLRSYEAIKSQLRMARAENEHLLDMISEVYPEVDEDLTSSDESLQSGNEGGRVNSYSIGSTSTGKLGGRHFEDAGDLGADDMPLGRRYRKRELSLTNNALDPMPQLTKRRRRQGKRDDRNDPKPIEPLKRDESGNLVFPIVVGRGQDEVRIHDLGRVKWEPDTYHTSRYIWTVGFKSTRVYPSMKDKSARCIYTSEILDGGDMPVFQVTASDMPESPFRASSSSGVWKQILDILMAKGIGVKTHASGPQMYGLSHLGVTKVIQELENASRCSKYIMQKWIEPGKPFAHSEEFHEDEAMLTESAQTPNGFPTDRAVGAPGGRFAGEYAEDFE
ncbi:hypothetical protein GGI12_003360 [Dipsacomyces acuminosporus]|nr:hypothetical protein GGI12_003360 [Dipsacomyces acuminosporus]